MLRFLGDFFAADARRLLLLLLLLLFLEAERLFFRAEERLFVRDEARFLDDDRFLLPDDLERLRDFFFAAIVFLLVKTYRDGKRRTVGNCVA
jgi:hypothetical protein